MNNNKLIILNSFFKEKKYSYYKIIDINDISSFCDNFIIVSFDNIKTLQVICDELEYFCVKNDIEIRNFEGKKTDWLLIDLNEIIIHLFTEENRKFYNLEKIWADGKEIDINHLTLI